jgi:hypothetical protein
VAGFRACSLLTICIRFDWGYDGRSLLEPGMYSLQAHDNRLRPTLLHESNRYEFGIMVGEGFDPVHSRERSELLLHGSIFRINPRHNRRASLSLVGRGCAGKWKRNSPRLSRVGGCLICQFPARAGIMRLEACAVLPTRPSILTCIGRH